MVSDSDHATAPSASGRRFGSISSLIIWVLPGIAMVCLIFYFSMGRSRATVAQPEVVRVQTATELIAATGAVRVLKTGETEWKDIRAGAHLQDGDLIRTDTSGNAGIRYPDGTTVSIQARTIFAVQRTGNNEMEILMPAASVAGDNAVPASSGLPEDSSPVSAKTGALRPFLNLQRIVPFGRSLELIGYVEPGSSLTVNDETVEVKGDGSYKHFTKPFPKSIPRAHLVMKATNLAGQTSQLTATYNFSSRAGDN